jgi:LPXTG-motif cell wall-anchored protein
MKLVRVDPPIPFSSAAKLITTGAWSSPLALLGLVVVFLAASWVTLRRRDT